MHISDGVLSPPILAGGALVAAGEVAFGLKKMDPEEIPEVALLSSAFFVGSLIHIPVGPTSVHLVLSGLLGLLLGRRAAPAILIGLFLQALLFQYGGVTVLGVNVAIMATPALLCHCLFRRPIRSERSSIVWLSGFGAGALAILLGAGLIGLVLALAGQAFQGAAKVAVVAHVPVLIVEGLLTGFCAVFLSRVKPELLGRTAPLTQGGYS